MDKAAFLNTLVVVRSLDVTKDPFCLRKDDEEILGLEVTFLTAIGNLLYLSNFTRPDISFIVSILSRFSISFTQRYWKGIKKVFRYLRGTDDLGLFYHNKVIQRLVGYVDTRYLSNAHKFRSPALCLLMEAL